METIIRRRAGIAANISTDYFKRLSETTLPGCPFEDYTAWDLLRDLINMYSWKLDYNKLYSINEFLTLCNDAHAVAYKNILAA